MKNMIYQAEEVSIFILYIMTGAILVELSVAVSRSPVLAALLSNCDDVSKE